MSMRDKYAIIIVNSIEPYCYEINNYLAPPHGFSYRFRHQKSENSDWMPTIDNPNILEGEFALVVTRHFETAEFLPVRIVKIQNVSVIGDIVYIDYSLEDLFRLYPDHEKRKTQLQEFQEFISTESGDFNNTPDEDLENLVFFTHRVQEIFNIEATHKSDEIQDWGVIVRELGKLDVYKNFDFLKIVNVTDSGGNTAVTSDRGDKGSSFKLVNGVTYDIQLLQRTFTHRDQGDSSIGGNRKIVIESGSEIDDIIERRDITGKYDLHEFKIEPNSITKPTNSFLSVNTRSGSNEDEHSIELPLRVGPSRWEKVITVVSGLMFIGSASLFMFSSAVDGISVTPTIRNALIVVMIIAASAFKRPAEGYLSLVGIR